MGSVIASTVWRRTGGGGAARWRFNKSTFMKHQKRTMAMLKGLFTSKEQLIIY
jgi:hypothetical protein